jgi:quercetin dioxygenase-like cupin family protein
VSTIGEFSSLAAEAPYEGVSRRMFDAEGATIVQYVFEPNAAFPLHEHAQEQITFVEEGELELSLDGRQVHLSAGSWAVVPPGAAHSAVAGRTGARILCVLVPRRDERNPIYTVAS